MDGAWDASFPPNFGAPARAQFAQLASWTTNPDDDAKYFSGTATYAKSLTARLSESGLIGRITVILCQ